MAAPTNPPSHPNVPAKSTERRVRFFDPFDIFDELRGEVGRLWGQRPLMPRPVLRPFAQIGEEIWAPRMDVFDRNGTLVVKVELPGIKKEDVTVHMEDGDLVIHGNRKMEEEVREEDYYRLERAYGTFQRRLPIPFEVKSDQVKATFQEGVLEVQIPKPAKAAPEPTRIAVN